MSSTRSSLLVSLGAVALALAACTTPPPPAPPIVMPPPVLPVPPVAPPPLPPEAVKPPPAPWMTPTTFGALPGWGQDDQRQAWPALKISCGQLIGKDLWKAACSAARDVDANDLAAVRGFFETWFVPNQMRSADGADTGLITGYYEAALRGSRKKGGAYQTPLYRIPSDMLSVELGELVPELKGRTLRGKLYGKKVQPYPARAVFERAPPVGDELLWVDDPVEAFFLEVQGSGRVVLDSGDTVRMAYAGQNGHPYKAIGRWLVDNGEIPSAEISAQAIKKWLAAHPERRQELFNVNPSRVFFKEEALPDPRVGPNGAMGVPLTPSRSMAVDRAFIPLGAPIYLATTEPSSTVPLQRLMLAQDTGGAIKGEVRADFFFGFGEQAADNAGRMKQRGAIWVLMPKAR